MGLQLPTFPKSRSIFSPDPDQINQLADHIQTYLRMLVNDITILEQIKLRERIFDFLGL